jgi:pimeloyl-ACP methyl ester carboxylesterase
MYALTLLLAATVQAVDVAVMVHGAGGGGWEYHLWKPVFEKAGWKVIAPDLVPIEGGLAKTKFSDYVEQVKAWSKRDGGKLVVIGASMGGILALKAAETARPDAIVLVNSTLPKEIRRGAAGERSPQIIRWANGPREDTVAAMPDSTKAEIEFAWKRWRDESGTVVNEIRSGISALKPKCPTLIVLGQGDTDIPYTDGLRLAEWAGADVHLYAGMSHVGPLMSTRTEEVAESIVSWLRKQFLPGMLSGASSEMQNAIKHRRGTISETLASH